MSLKVSPFRFVRRCVTFDDGTVSRGLTKVIKQVFSARYSYRAVVRNDAARHTHGSSIKYGKAVDRELTRWVRFGEVPNKTHAGKIVEYFEANDLVAVGAQYTVAWPDARLATQLDLVLRDERTQRLVVVEIKTGSVNRHIGTGKDLVGHPGVSNCLLHQHQLQVALGRFLLARTCGTSEADYDTLLLYANTDATIDVYRDTRIPGVTSEKVQSLLLSTAQDRTTRKRKKKRRPFP